MNGGDSSRSGIRTVELRFPDGGTLELVEPLSEDSPVRRFLDKRGEGFHHATFYVSDLEATLAQLADRGYEVTGTDLSRAQRRETFVRPGSGFGSLIQIVETDGSAAEMPIGSTLEDVTDGMIDWTDEGPRRRHT